MLGITVGVVELSIFFIFGFFLRKKNIPLRDIDLISYFWLLMTILTFIWEVSFIGLYKKTSSISQDFINNNTHVWTKNYDLTYILPWKLATIFYGEYGAHADRKYMLLLDDWSRIIEGTHALFCGIFALTAIILKMKNKHYKFYIAVAVSMGTQLMNSILYMANYFNQLYCIPNVSSKDPFNININCNSNNFPTGFALIKRPFMYVNIFWTALPLYVIINAFIKSPPNKNYFKLP